MKLKYFDVAKATAKHSESHPKMGCAIVYKNRVISVGFNNREKTHPKCTWYRRTWHAEHHAMMGVSKEVLKGSTCYVYRETKRGQMAMARPCKSCMVLLAKAGVKRICYSTPEGFAEERITSYAR